MSGAQSDDRCGDASHLCPETALCAYHQALLKGSVIALRIIGSVVGASRFAPFKGTARNQPTEQGYVGCFGGRFIGPLRLCQSFPTAMQQKIELFAASF